MKKAKTREVFKSVGIKIPNPKPLNPACSNGNEEGPITEIEIMGGTHEDGEHDLVWWARDGENATAYSSLADLCEEYGFDLAEMTKIVTDSTGPLDVTDDAAVREFAMRTGDDF